MEYDAPVCSLCIFPNREKSYPREIACRLQSGSLPRRMTVVSCSSSLMKDAVGCPSGMFEDDAPSHNACAEGVIWELVDSALGGSAILSRNSLCELLPRDPHRRRHDRTVETVKLGTAKLTVRLFKSQLMETVLWRFQDCAAIETIGSRAGGQVASLLGPFA